MLARIRRSALEASSLISPFGSKQRRIAACKSRKSPSFGTAWRPAAEIWPYLRGTAASASSRFPAVIRHPEIPWPPAPFRALPAAPSTVPDRPARQIPVRAPTASHSRASRISANARSSGSRFVLTSSASITRFPGAHVVRSRSNSRSLSNSNTSLCRPRHFSSFLSFSAPLC